MIYNAQQEPKIAPRTWSKQQEKSLPYDMTVNIATTKARMAIKGTFSHH
jgi:hypothetical protein